MKPGKFFLSFLCWGSLWFMGTAQALIVENNLLFYQTPFSENEKKIVNLLNEAEVTVNISLKVNPYPGISEKYSAVNWVQLNSDHFELAPGERYPLGVFVFTPEYVLGTHAAELVLEVSPNALSVHKIKIIHVAPGAQRIVKVTGVDHILRGDVYRINLKLNNAGESWAVLTGFASVVREDSVVSGKIKLPEVQLMPGESTMVSLNVPITYALTERGNKLKVYFLINGVDEQIFEQFLVKEEPAKVQVETSIPKNDPLAAVPALNFKLLTGSYKYQNKKIKAYLRVSNYSDLAITPTAYVSVFDGHGKRVLEWSLPPKTIRAGYEELLSGSSAAIALKSGKYDVKVKLLFQKQEVSGSGQLIID